MHAHTHPHTYACEHTCRYKPKATDFFDAAFKTNAYTL